MLSSPGCGSDGGGKRVAYRNKTFVSFASEDILSYRLMQAWNKNENIDFSFHDAHDLNTALDTSQPETIRRRLRERLSNTKQVVLLVGNRTRVVAADPSRFLYYEVETILDLDLPVVFANLNGVRVAERSRLPARLLGSYTMSVSFQAKAIKKALDEFVDGYTATKATQKGPYQYKPEVYRGLGL
jgi:hypothetical protein